MLFCVALSAQEATTTIQQINDSTFLKTTTTVFENGSVNTLEEPLSKIQIVDMILEQNSNLAIVIDQRNNQNTTDQRTINDAKRYVRDTFGLSEQYDSLFASKLLTALTGDWQLIERKDTVSKNSISIAAHPANTKFLRAKETTGSRAWNIVPVDHLQKFEIRNYSVAGVGETVEMTLTQFANFTGYRGKASDGSVLILRR